MVIFKVKPRKVSNSSYGFTIPGDYVKNGLIDVSKVLIVDVKEEVEDGSDDQSK